MIGHLRQFPKKLVETQGIRPRKQIPDSDLPRPVPGQYQKGLRVLSMAAALARCKAVRDDCSALMPTMAQAPSAWMPFLISPARPGFSPAPPLPKPYVKKMDNRKMIRQVRFILPPRAI